ncbi:hypothetical protein GS429_19390 [Natronorubrum sp. JWXQ-INN-674]|uniref:Uncharacterized protein n=1 Tax=Natronorubrum halalkaliphilum TaxID=2691917 RepID=A0A6B0VRA5_9EURY|nr:hypothetical protein [Natronorubrum halalkaliphilum]MXV64190.1 hypothetical protein [Natronorubrum halalkaliphilum]
MIALVAGLAFVALGVAGIQYAPAIVAAQHRQGMAPFEDREGENTAIDAADRIRVTKGTGVVFVVVGFALLVYGSGVL